MRSHGLKVVLFCGGYGMRMRGSATDDVPKPMQLVGPYPLLWHVMRYFAHFGHKEFILCLGYGAQMIKDYFLNHAPTAHNDFALRGGKVELLDDEMSDWTINFVDTGLTSSIGERLRRVRPLLGDDEIFLANYADVLTDADLPSMIDSFVDDGQAVASVMSVPPQDTFHVLEVDEKHRVTKITPVATMPMRVNGGMIILRQEVFDHLGPGEDLIGDAYARLATQGRALAQPYDGFWKAADTFKERAELDRMWTTGQRPWAIWDRGAEPPAVTGDR